VISTCKGSTRSTKFSLPRKEKIKSHEVYMQHIWQPGDQVIHRHVGHADWISWSHPHIVLSDTPEQTVLFKPEGTTVERFDRHTSTSLKTQTIRMHILRIMYADCPYAVLLFFDAGTGVPPWYERHFSKTEGVFKGWKVDIESPYKRTQFGFDTTDNTLDIIAQPDLSWHWKDEEGTTTRVAQGVYSAEEAQSFYADGQKAITAIEKRQVPFSEPWPEWRPDPSWPIPTTRSGWEALPGADIDLSRCAPRPLQRFKPVE
jgi:hypothetical protein